MRDVHAERLTVLDAAFLASETPNHHMHVGGVFIFEGGDHTDFTFEAFQHLVRSRLHLVPRYRQKLAPAPLGLAQPSWIDDPNFDLAYHVRHAALPHPGGIDQLLDYAARVLSHQLDRSRPLWELYVVEGLEGGRFAMIGKNHHAIVDGLASVDILNVLLDRDPTERALHPQPWDPRPAPSGMRRMQDVMGHALTRPGAVVAGARHVAQRPLEMAARAAGVGRGIAATVGSLVGRTPRSVLNQEPGIQRRMAMATLDLEAVKAVKDAFGTTVNDVVLAATGDMLGRYLRHRHQPTDGVVLRAMVPVSVAATGEQATHVTSVFVDLPVGEMDSVARLRRVHGEMVAATAAHQAVGADALVNLAGFAPATLHVLAARAATSQRLYNVLVTNVPGPQDAVHALGARLVGACPFVPLAGMQALGVGFLSLEGVVHVGFTADWDALPDLSIMPDLLGGAVDELVASARALHRVDTAA
nr:putative wax ester synthase/acyl-CoA:diacylglycerol acyltransferase [uncultured bacterium]